MRAHDLEVDRARSQRRSFDACARCEVLTPLLDPGGASVGADRRNARRFGGIEVRETQTGGVEQSGPVGRRGRRRQVRSRRHDSGQALELAVAIEQDDGPASVGGGSRDVGRCIIDQGMTHHSLSRYQNRINPGRPLSACRH